MKKSLWMLVGLAIMTTIFCTPAQPRVCDPGATQKCVCADGHNGAQNCAIEGTTWSACRCTSEEPVGTDGGDEKTPEAPMDDVWCRTNTDCPEGMDCTEAHECVKIIPPKKAGELCTKDTECTAGLFCDKVCKKPECASNEECSAGKKCINMMCQPSP